MMVCSPTGAEEAATHRLASTSGTRAPSKATQLSSKASSIKSMKTSNPFWGMETAETRNSLADWKQMIRIRNGTIEDATREDLRSFAWTDMIENVAAVLPDMEIMVSPLDESRAFVPWHEIDALTTKASRQNRSQ